MAIGSLALASVSTGCGDGDGPAAVTEQTDPLLNEPLDARIAFTSTRDGDSYIYVATDDGSQVRRLTRGTRPTWSPDGRWIAFTGRSGETSDLRVIRVDGSGERVVAAPAGMAAWSPDGTKILFSGDPWFATPGLFVVNPDGSGLTQVLSGDFDDPPGNWLGYPAWSPDGKSIAFLRENDYMWWGVYVINSDGSSPRNIAGGNLLEPSWSPDGTMMAVGHLGRVIGTMNADGSGLQLYDRALAFNPDWSPDGRSLIFEGFASSVGDSASSVGSRMRIYVLDRQTRAVRQLIPDAIAPKNPSYWDHEPVWLRSPERSAMGGTLPRPNLFSRA
ncbi:MAG TPA: LpqB family beta-propeller domain-containing protein [Gemmatimonadaceae bacterium]|jgi:Tol biopolymer transport system component|nr:LpqB family beta-propeller domain-containing protein [Gemmatimonadaceae bacterium]